MQVLAIFFCESVKPLCNAPFNFSVQLIGSAIFGQHKYHQHHGEEQHAKKPPFFVDSRHWPAGFFIVSVLVPIIWHIFIH
jgi:hypothetical protein